MQLCSFFAVNHQTGAALPGASVFVYLPGTTTKVSIYDGNGVLITNPATADANGMVSFAAADGVYDIVIVSGAYTSPTIPKLQFLDVSAPAEPRYILTNADLPLRDGDRYVIINKTADENTNLTLLNPDTLSSVGVITLKDGKGNASVRNTHMNAPTGKTVDGQAFILIDTNWGVVRLLPVPGVGYLTV